MYIKKFLALFLAAAVLACGLAGCGATVEHHFDDDQYSAAAEAAMRSISASLGRVETLVNSHDVELYGAFAQFKDGSLGRPDGNVTDTAFTQAALDSWAQNPRHKLCTYAESGRTIEEYLPVWQRQIDAAYNALSTLTDAQWEAMHGKTLFLMGALVESGGKVYVETSLSCA